PTGSVVSSGPVLAFGAPALPESAVPLQHVLDGLKAHSPDAPEPAACPNRVPLSPEQLSALRSAGESVAPTAPMPRVLGRVPALAAPGSEQPMPPALDPRDVPLPGGATLQRWSARPPSQPACARLESR